MRTDGLTAAERAQYDDAGFVLLQGIADAGTCAAVLDGARAAARGEADAEPVPMHVGDVLLFDSHLVHRSGDNVTADQRRGAMTYHFCATGTVDRGPGYVTDFVTVR